MTKRHTSLEGRLGLIMLSIAVFALLALLSPKVAMAQAGPAGDDLSDKGTITAMPSGTLFGQWVVNGNTYTAGNGTTEFRQDNGPLTLNGCAEVKYVVQNGQRNALRISSDDDCGGQTGEVESLGLVVSRPAGTPFGAWQIGNVTYQAISGTTTFREFNGALNVGVCAEVKWITPTTALRISSKQLHDCSGAGDDNEATGKVESLPAGGLIGVWHIGGLSYTVTPSTTLRDGPFAVGVIVEVHFTRSADGALTAIDIERKPGVEDGLSSAKLYGRIESRPAAPAVIGAWIIAGNTFSVTGNTLLSGTLNTGKCVEVHYHLSGATNVADKIKAEGEDDCPAGANGAISRSYGFVEAKPTGGLVGTWTIGGAAYNATTSTQFQERRGALIVGAFVKVSYTTAGGVRTAIEIETEDAPGSGSNLIGVLSISGNVWTVNGQSFIVDDATLIDDRLAEVRNGGDARVNVVSVPVATVNGTLSSQAVLVATEVAGLPAIERVLLPVILK